MSFFILNDIINISNMCTFHTNILFFVYLTNLLLAWIRLPLPCFVLLYYTVNANVHQEIFRLLLCAIKDQDISFPYHAVVVYCILSRSNTILQNRSE